MKMLNIRDPSDVNCSLSCSLWCFGAGCLWCGCPLGLGDLLALCSGEELPGPQLWEACWLQGPGVLLSLPPLHRE